jgi:hypothetical protein
MEKHTSLTAKRTVALKLKDDGEIPYYGWYKISCDAFLNLGRIKKAVVIRKAYACDEYFISTGSYFSFSDAIYNQRFETCEEAIKVASEEISLWLSETMTVLSEKPNID